MHFYNIRTTLHPPEILLKSTPIEKIAYRALDALVANEEVESRSKHATAKHMLAFFQQLNNVFTQDAAVLLVLHPKQKDHPIMAHFSVPRYSRLQEIDGRIS